MDAPSFHLLDDAWIPVRRRSGARGLIRPCEIVSDPFDPVVDVDWPRPDFRAATYEFLIGLLSTAAPPSSAGEWRRWWREPPTSSELEALFAPFATAFGLDGAGPRFMQDEGDIGDELCPVAGLLIEQPGANAEKNNTDLFQKRGRVETLGRSSAAMALFTLQAWAPSGGAGHRTSMRGGGPMTTLALPADAGESSLWRIVWLNVVQPWSEATEDGPEADPARTFPWLAPTRASGKTGCATYAGDIHPAQCFWGMPRRIALRFEANVDGRPCDVTGRVEDVIVHSYVTTTYGVNYMGVSHPLSPSYRMKAGDEWLPLHPQPGCLAWRYWPGFAIGGEAKSGRGMRRAPCVELAAKRLHALEQGEARLWIVGYDMDNAKARGFVEAERPFFPVDEERRSHLSSLAAMLVTSATEVASCLSGAIRDARGSDKGVNVELAVEGFWIDTEDAFWSALRNRSQAEDTWPAFFRDEWLKRILSRAALGVFDRAAPLDGFIADGEIDDFRRAGQARQRLSFALAGYGAQGKRIFDALNIAQPTKKTKGKGAAHDAHANI